MSDFPLSRRQFAGHLATGVPFAKPPSAIDRQLALLQQRHPDARLDAAALAEIREDLETQAARSLVLSAFPLKNADEPGFVVQAFRKS
jgi:hypothetical protein